MSGGRLVVLDRLGREVKRYPLPSGLATLGSDPRCDIRVMLPTVSGHHATVVVHTNQTVVRNVGSGQTLVNGLPVSVAALRHGDVVSLGERSLRWDYADPAAARRNDAPQLALYVGSRAGRSRRRLSGPGAPPPRSPALQLALEMQHRASMPGGAGGKQVAVVQPQRRDAADHNDQSPASKRQRGAKHDGASSPNANNVATTAHTTKAEQWIQSRKTSPRRAANNDTAPTPPPQQSPTRPVYPGRKPPASAKKSTPLRMFVLRRAHSTHGARTPRVTKIQAPTVVDHTKQAALMLMAGHTPKPRLPSPKTNSGKKTPSYVIKKPSPVRRTPRGSQKHTPKAGATTKVSPKTVVTPKVSPKTVVTPKVSPRTSFTPKTPGSAASRRTSKRGSRNQTVSILEISESEAARMSASCVSLPPSPRKSALRDPAARGNRKTDSIKFDLSNLEPSTRSQRSDVLTINDTTRGTYDNSVSEDELTLHYSDTSSVQSPSPRKSIHSRSSRMLEKSIGSSLIVSPSQIRSTRSTLTAASPDSSRRKSNRGNLIVSKVLDASDNSRYSRRTTKTLTDHSFDTTAASAFKTRTLSPRSPNLETYSIVDLVSIDSNESIRSSSVYNSAGSTNSSAIAFGTPQNSIGRKTRSTIDPSTLIGSSTPYVAKTRNSSMRSQSLNRSSVKSERKSGRSSGSSRRSKSLITPENTQRHISVNSTKISRASKSRSRISDSDLLLISSSDISQVEDESPRSSRRVSRNSKPDVTSPVLETVARRSKSNETSPVISRTSRSNPVSPVISRTSRSNQASPVVSRTSKISPRISRTSKSPISPVAGRRTKSNEPSPVLNRKTRSNPTSPISPRAKSNQTSPVISRKPKSVRPSLGVGRKSKTPVSPASPAPKRKSSRRSGGNTTPSSSEGISTPENRRSPRDEGTPVLSIQSLLDSSQGSLASSSKKTRSSINIKRKTIGAIRSEPRRRTGLKSKSLNFSARRGLLRLSKDSSIGSDKTDEGAPKPSNEKMITPKSAVKLVQEAVKNKHSTAKKPQSKRSIIDNLDESDIVKQLFNSPVKRKLSQSMTEFSRKQLFDDDDVAPRRPTRNTIALTGRTPDNSILDNTEAFTPERFVSPISTPNNSPNLTGIKRLFRKNTPDNDLRNVRGVKALLKTPRTRHSIRNDLTNVFGVKQVFAKSPKNRLSDVRVKEVFAASPKDDLRRISGVKTLFKTQKTRKSPRNDLSDVRGVKNLFQPKSPANDLRRVSGVKRALQKNSPKNDLTDVRGVKRMFRRQKDINSLNDVSGVEQLFNESNHSVRDTEILFDQLIGKPPIKAVYSKSFVKKPIQKRKSRSAKSLHASIDVITSNVEEWIEQELQKRLHRDDKASKVSKELQNLATDTVEGAEPIRVSRVRNSTVLKTVHLDSSERKKSASELYSAHTLPIKKRSLVETSLDKTGNRSKNSLPIKKRVVVHSTPVKGRSRLTMNASELGRVSPISLADTSLRSEQQAEPKTARGKRVTKAAIEVELLSPRTRSPPKAKPSPRTAKASPRTSKVSPRTSKALSSNPSIKVTKHSPKVAKSSPKKSKPSPKATKSSPEKAKSPPKATKSSPEKPKSPPKASPRKSESSRKSLASQTSEEPIPKTRSTRARGAKTDTSHTNAKKTRPSLLIAKKSPVMSPKPAPRTRRGKVEPKDTSAKEAPVENVKETPKKTRSSRKDDKPATPKRNTRAKVQKATVVVSKPSPQLKPQAKTRGKAETAAKVIESPKTRGKRESEPPKGKVKGTEVQRRARKTTASDKTIEEVESRTKRRKVESPKESPKRTRRTAVEVEPKGKSNKPNNKVVQIEPKGRRNKLNESNSKDVTKSPVNKRGRKDQEVVEKPEPKRTRKTQVKADEKKTDVVDSKSKKTDEVKSTRSRKKLEPQPSTQSEPAGRARRGKAAVETTVIPEVRPRKRKSTAEEVLPAKISKVADTKARKGRKTVENSETQTSNSRQKRSAAADAKATRSSKQAAKDNVPKTTNRKQKTEANTSPVKESPAKQTAGSRRTRAAVVVSPAKKSPVKKSPAKKAPAKKSPAKKAPAKKSPAKKAPAKKSPVKKAPAKKSPVKKSPAEKSPAKSVGTRATRGKPEPAIVVTKTTGRSRRR